MVDRHPSHLIGIQDFIDIYIYIIEYYIYIYIYRNPLFNQWIFALIDPLLSNIYIYIYIIVNLIIINGYYIYHYPINGLIGIFGPSSWIPCRAAKIASEPKWLDEYLRL